METYPEKLLRYLVENSGFHLNAEVGMYTKVFLWERKIYVSILNDKEIAYKITEPTDIPSAKEHRICNYRLILDDSDPEFFTFEHNVILHVPDFKIIRRVEDQ